MKNVNELVLKVKEEGTESYAFVELFSIIKTETIEPKAKSFSKQLKGDVASAISMGVTLITELIESWNGTGNFHTLFKTSFDNRLKNLVAYQVRKKRRHNTSYDLSLSESTEQDGESSPILEVIDDRSLQTSFEVTDKKLSLSELMDKFKAENPEKGGVIEILSLFGDEDKQSDRTKALCDFYGVTDYKKIQKRVSRSREAFAKFLHKHDYQFAF